MLRKWQGEGEHRELIQLAALKVELHQKGLDIVEQFSTLIKPKINPQLSDYIIELTGITQLHIDSYGVDFSSAMHSFEQFSENGKLPVLAWGKDEEVIAENSQLQGQDMVMTSTTFIDLYQRMLSKGVVSKGVSSGQLAKFVGVVLEGHAHNALFDVDNIAIALDTWLARGVIGVADIVE